MANAFRHGNRRDPGKHIAVSYRLDATGAEVEVADEGEGFDPDAVPDPTTDGTLGRTGGRGVLMIRALFDEIEFKRGGRQVRLFLRTTSREVWVLEQSRRVGMSEIDLLRNYPTLRAQDLANAGCYVLAHRSDIDRQICENETD